MAIHGTTARRPLQSTPSLSQQSEPSATSVSSLAGTVWAGQFDGRPAELDVVSSSGAFFKYAGITETMTTERAADGQVVFRGTSYRRSTPSAPRSISLDVLQGRVSQRRKPAGCILASTTDQ